MPDDGAGTPVAGARWWSVTADDRPVPVERPRTVERSEAIRVVGCELGFVVQTATEIVVQIVASRTAGQVDHARFDVQIDGGTMEPLEEIRGPEGATLHVIRAGPGRLSVHYRAGVKVRVVGAPGDRRPLRPPGEEGGPSPDYERQLYLRPSRYCPSDHLIGFAVAEFGAGPDVPQRVAAIAEWIRSRIGYVPGSSTVHDSAEDTLLTGTGTCRDFAHLGVALCRATGIPARFAAVYAPGLSPMDFHAVFEAYGAGRWCVYDPTGLAPRSSLVRIATGRDAADTAFAAVNRGIVELETIEVTAIAEPFVPEADRRQLVELA